MQARLPGFCACCRRRYAPGAEIVRAAAGWVLASCAPARPAASSAEEVYEVLAHARAVAARTRSPQEE